jgi:hypothetical protein
VTCAMFRIVSELEGRVNETGAKLCQARLHTAHADHAPPFFGDVGSRRFLFVAAGDTVDDSPRPTWMELQTKKRKKAVFLIASVENY